MTVEIRENDIENGNNGSTLSATEVEKNCADLVHSTSKNARTHASIANPATSQQAIAPPISMTKFQKLENEYRSPHHGTTNRGYIHHDLIQDKTGDGFGGKGGGMTLVP